MKLIELIPSCALLALAFIAAPTAGQITDQQSVHIADMTTTPISGYLRTEGFEIGPNAHVRVENDLIIDSSGPIVVDGVIEAAPGVRGVNGGNGGTGIGSKGGDSGDGGAGDGGCFGVIGGSKGFGNRGSGGNFGYGGLGQGGYAANGTKGTKGAFTNGVKGNNGLPCPDCGQTGPGGP